MYCYIDGWIEDVVVVLCVFGGVKVVFGMVLMGLVMVDIVVGLFVCGKLIVVVVLGELIVVNVVDFVFGGCFVVGVLMGMVMDNEEMFVFVWL